MLRKTTNSYLWISWICVHILTYRCQTGSIARCHFERQSKQKDEQLTQCLHSRTDFPSRGHILCSHNKIPSIFQHMAISHKPTTNDGREPESNHNAPLNTNINSKFIALNDLLSLHAARRHVRGRNTWQTSTLLTISIWGFVQSIHSHTYRIIRHKEANAPDDAFKGDFTFLPAQNLRITNC